MAGNWPREEQAEQGTGQRWGCFLLSMWVLNTYIAIDIIKKIIMGWAKDQGLDVPQGLVLLATQAQEQTDQNSAQTNRNSEGLGDLIDE